MKTIARGPAILSTCVKLALVRFCMQRRLFATTSYKIRYGEPFLANRACKSSRVVCAGYFLVFLFHLQFELFCILLYLSDDCLLFLSFPLPSFKTVT